MRMGILVCIGLIAGAWGFHGHRTINRRAVFSLPPPLIGLYKKHLAYLEDASVNPDKRRYIVVDEAPRHYIDLDTYAQQPPVYWKEAVAMYGEDSLKAHGILPWHIYRTFLRLRSAWEQRDRDMILRISADLGHYIGDAHVPLHTTRNYNGQYTGQVGIHGLWESRLPELFLTEYDFLVGKAKYIADPQQAAWHAIVHAHQKVDSVLDLERYISVQLGNAKYAFESKGRQTVRVYAYGYAKAYHNLLRSMVETQMRSAIQMTADFWYTAWVDAGQPDIKKLSQGGEQVPQEDQKLLPEQKSRIRAHEE